MLLFLTLGEPPVGHPPFPFSVVERMANGWGGVVCWGAQGLSFCLLKPVGACVPGRVRDFTKVPACYCRHTLHQIPQPREGLTPVCDGFDKTPLINATLYLHCVTGDAQGFI